MVGSKSEILTTRDPALKNTTAHPVSTNEGGLGGFRMLLALSRAVATWHFFGLKTGPSWRLGAATKRAPGL